MILKPLSIRSILFSLLLAGHQVFAAATVASAASTAPAPAVTPAPTGDAKKVEIAPAAAPAPAAATVAPATPAVTAPVVTPAPTGEVKKADVTPTVVAPAPAASAVTSVPAPAATPVVEVPAKGKDKSGKKPNIPSAIEIAVKGAEKAVTKAKAEKENTDASPVATDKDKENAAKAIKVAEAALVVAQAKKAAADVENSTTAKDEDKKAAHEKVTAAEKAMEETKAPSKTETKPETKAAEPAGASDKDKKEAQDSEASADVKEAARKLRNAQFILVRAIRAELNTKRLYEVTLRQTETRKETCLRVYRELKGLTKSLEKRFTVAKQTLTDVEAKLKEYVDAKSKDEKAMGLAKEQVDLARARIGRVSKDRAAAYRSLKIASKCAKSYMKDDQTADEGDDDDDDLDDEERGRKRELEEDDDVEGAEEEADGAGKVINDEEESGDGGEAEAEAEGKGEGEGKDELPAPVSAFGGNCDPSIDLNGCVPQTPTTGNCDISIDANGCVPPTPTTDNCDISIDANGCVPPSTQSIQSIQSSGNCDPSIDLNGCVPQGGPSGQLSENPPEGAPASLPEEREILAVEAAVASTEEDIKEAAAPEFAETHALVVTPEEPVQEVVEGLLEEDKGPHDEDAERKALEKAHEEVDEAEEKVLEARDSGNERRIVDAEIEEEDAEVKLSKAQIEQSPYGKKLKIKNPSSWENDYGKELFDAEAPDKGGVFNPRMATSESVSDIVMEKSTLNESGGYVVERPRMLAMERPGSSASTTEKLNMDLPNFRPDSGIQAL